MKTAAVEEIRPNLFTDSTPILSNPVALRARASDDGYLFFKGIVPVDKIREARRDILSVLDRHGWLNRESSLMDGLVDLEALSAVPAEEMRDDIGVSRAIYDDVQRLETMHALPHAPSLTQLYQTLFGADVLVHPRHIARVVTPHPAMVPTPIHQDFPHIQGTAETWTAWIPLGDCPRSMGGLTVLRGSHRQGYIPVQPASGAGGIQAQLCPWENDWVEGDFAAGDLLTFPSFTVHKALKAERRDLVRLSLDVRYQSVEEPVEQNSLHSHCELEWDEIYKDWESSALQYYWRDMPLTINTLDRRYTQPGRRIC